MNPSQPTITAGPGPGPVRRQQRLWLACSECRIRKVKCDRARPCLRCAKAGRGDGCRYDNDVSGLSQQSLSAPGQMVFAVEKPVYDEEPLQHVQIKASSNTAGEPLPAPFGHTQHSPAPSHAPPLQLLWHGSRAVDRYVEPFTGKTLSVPKEVMFGENDATVYWGRSHETNYVPRIMDRTNLLFKSDEEDDVSILYQVERRTRPKEAISSGVFKPYDPDLLCLLPPRAESDRLVQIYVDHFESYYKIIHVPLFLGEYERIWDNDVVTSTHGPPHLLAQILAICAISSCFTDDAAIRQTNTARARQWIDAVSFWLFKQNPRAQMMLGFLQAHLLMLVAGDVHWIKIDRSWISAGALVRNAISAGLHREPSDFVRVSPFYAELRRRLWYSILEFDLQASFAKGRNPSVRDDDYDCALPSELDDEQLFDGMGEMELPQSATGKPMAASIHRLLAQSLSLRTKVCRLINSISLTAGYDEVLRLDAELKSFLREASNIIDIGHAPEPFRRVFFTVLARRATIALHGPFVARTLDDPRYLYSRQVCVETATTILAESLSILDEQWQQRQISSGAFTTITNICRCEISNSVFLICHELVTRAVEQGRRESERLRLPPSGFQAPDFQHPWAELLLLVELVEKTAAALGQISMPGDIVSQRTCAWVQLSADLSRAATTALTGDGTTVDVASAMKISIRQSVEAYRNSIFQTQKEYPVQAGLVDPDLVDGNANGVFPSENWDFEGADEDDYFNLFLDIENMVNSNQYIPDA